MARPRTLPNSLPPRFVDLDAAAAYLSLSATKFAALVKEGRAPPPRRIDRRKAWEVRDLDRFADSMPYDGGEAVDSTWSD